MAKSKTGIQRVGNQQVQGVDRENKGPSVLTRLQFFEWALAIEKLMHEKTRGEVLNQKYLGMEKDLKIQNMNMALFKGNLSAQKEKTIALENEYNSVKASIEGFLGISLNGCVIDDVTLEVKKLEE